MPMRGPGSPATSALAETTAFRNGTLQGAYLIMAARSLGLDIGPMSGFDNAKVDEAFFAGTDWKSNFLVNLGYGDPSGLFARSPRLLLRRGLPAGVNRLAAFPASIHDGSVSRASGGVGRP